MKSRKKEPPSWIKTIGDALLYGGTGGLAGKNPLASAAYDKSRSSGVLPSNANAFIKFAIGDKEGLTEKDFSDEDVSAIMELIQKAESEGRSHVGYYDYPSGSDKMSPHGRVSTTLGQFVFDKGKDGSYSIEEGYDFNYPEVYKEMLSKETGLSVQELEDQGHIERFLDGYNKAREKGSSAFDSAYSSLRSNVTPFIDREPMPVKVKVKKKAQEGMRLKKDPPKGYKYTDSGDLVPVDWSEFHEEPDSLNLEAIKKGISMAESLGGVLMMNPHSTATGMYGQRYSEVKDLPIMSGVSREQFAQNPELQEKVFEMRMEEGIGGPSLRRNAMELTEEYAPQLGDDWNFSLDDVAFLSNFLGRQRTREYFASLRDGTEFKVPGINKTPEEYLKIAREAAYKD